MENKVTNSILAKSRMKIAISNFEEEEKENKIKSNLPKMVATFLLTLGLTAGLVYASNIAYEKIWKEPTSYKYKSEITEEEKAESITEETAEKIGNDYLKKIGFTEETIQDLGLMRDWRSQENEWHMSSKKVTIIIDGKTGKLKSAQIPTWNYTIPYNYGITREEARKVAKELLEKYRPEDDNSEYELVSLKRNSEIDEEAYIWYADFYKKYGDLINPEEYIMIGWVPTINGLYSLNINSNIFENNEQKISEEEAIKIATDKDKQIEKNKTIKEIKTKIRIKKMNEKIYLRENFKEEYENGTLNLEKIGDNTYKIKDGSILYKTENRVRKVWCVVIYYNEGIMPVTYYVDSTTGEIIGGQMYDELFNENILEEDPNNVIEK